MPFFLNPFAFAGLAAIPILVGIYYLRNRFKRRVVSSLILWDGIIKSNEGGQKRDRLQLPWIFILELLGLLALAFAATQPFFKTTNNRIPLTIVLDDSYSMLATPKDLGGESVRDKVIEAVEKLAKTNAYDLDIILAGQNAQRLSASDGSANDSPLATVDDLKQLDEALANWRCQQSSADLFQATEMVKKMHGPAHRILVYSDHPPNRESMGSDPSLQWISFGSAEENTAITYASRQSVSSQQPGSDTEKQSEKLLIRIENFSADKDAKKNNVNATIKIVDSTNDQTIIDNSFQFESNSKKEIVLDLPDSIVDKDLRIEIGDDAVLADNRLFLLAEKVPEINVYVNLKDQSYEKLWLDALKVVPNVKVNIVPPSECDLVITDNEFVMQPEQWHIYCPPQENPVAFAGPYAVSAEHPLANGLPIRGAIWAASAAKNETFKNLPVGEKSGEKAGEKSAAKHSNLIKNVPAENEAGPENGLSNAVQSQAEKPPRTQPSSGENEPASNESAKSAQREIRTYSVVRTGQSDLVSDQQLSQLRRRIRINLVPQFSTVSTSPPTWIVMVVNLIEWRRKFLHGPERINTWQTNQAIRFPLDTTTATLTDPNNVKHEIPVINGMAQVDTFQNGIWKIATRDDSGTTDLSTNESNSQNAAANMEKQWQWSFYPLSQRESNLQSAESVEINNWRALDVESRVIFQPFAWLLGLFALLLLVAGCIFQKPTA